MAASLGAGGFSVELDRNSDSIFVALTGQTSSPNTRFLRLYPLSYNSTTKTWSVGSAVTVQSVSGTAPSWSAATVAIERAVAPATQDYLWVGADEKSSSNTYTAKGWYATLSPGGALGSTWTATTIAINTGSSYSHYPALLGLDDGVIAFGRGSNAQKSARFRRPTGTWDATVDLEGYVAWNSGKEYSVAAVRDPRSPQGTTLVPLLAMARTDPNNSNNRLAIRLYFWRHEATEWDGDSTAATDDALLPQLASDGTSFYLFRQEKTDATHRKIHGQRARFPYDLSPLLRDPDRVWVQESADADQNLKWHGLPHSLGAEIIPIFTIRDKATDQLVVQASRVDLLGERSSWEYQTIPLPGAGLLKVNLANGNLHYEMVDADFPSRKWNDTVKRSYDSLRETTPAALTLFGDRWSGLVAPKLEISADEKTVVYWTGDGGKYLYLKESGTGTWKPELGMHTILEKPNASAQKVWRLTDLYGNRLLFDATGKVSFKRDGEFTDTSDNFWTWDYSVANRVKISGNTGRTQTYYLDATTGRVGEIRIAKPGLAADSCNADPAQCYYYKYEYDTNGRLSTVTLVSNSTEFAGGSGATRVRVTYGYDSVTGLLKSITTPEGSLYEIHYDSGNRVDGIKLPDPTSGAASDCGQTYCWKFAWQEGLGQTTVTDPRGKAWVYKSFGSGAVYEVKDPLGNVTKRSWTGDQNMASRTDPLNKTTSYEYDVNGNRTRIVDPVNGTNKPTSFEYNTQNRRTKLTSPRGNAAQTPFSTTYTWTGRGDLDLQTDAESHAVDRDYDSVRQLERLTDARGKVTTWVYDAHGQVETETRPDGTKTKYTRDVWGRVIETRVGGTAEATTDQVTRTTYDDLGRARSSRVRMTPNSVTTDDNQIDLLSSTTYDRDGNVLTQTDPNGGVTTTSSDRRGRITALDGPLITPGDNSQRPCTAYEYDQAGNRTKVRQAITRGATAGCSYPNAAITWSEVETVYDDRGLKSQEKRDGGTIVTAWHYDAARRLDQVTDPRGNYVVLGYDDKGRKITEEAAEVLTGVSGPGCHGISGAVCSTRRWEYDENGFVTTERIPLGSASPQAEVSRSYVISEVEVGRAPR